MRLGRTGTIWTAFAIPALVMACTQASAPDAPAQRDGATIYLVRHAEKLDAGRDPGLSEAGMNRARALAERLSGADLKTIWSTDYERTRATAAPLAQSLRVQVEIYDPSNLDAFADTLEDRSETALVVGHSNTTPALAATLGGKAGEPIDEAQEYDRLYILKGVGSETVETAIERYGASDEPRD